ncbi:TIGR01777 family oxidoreductase [Thermophagus sp. OGC60D27]|uniref:TIGR01777 family oxidoreductase n=1 Tax=Thermophagus sp. OGC60D27 TaxID=3458415 RepID=UPI0040378B85
MNIAISGITGLIGRALSEHLRKEGYSVIGLLRDDFGKGEVALAEKLEGCDAVVNLAGAPVLKRWTTQWKETIYSSRVDSTSLLRQAMGRMKSLPKVVVSASAVGIYDTLNVHDEYSNEYSNDFLGKVCQDWEKEMYKVNRINMRLCIARFGVVLSNKGGALRKMITPFKLGLGGKMGDGFQPMPFIHVDDAVRAIQWLISSADQEGIYNFVAPQMITNGEFTKELGEVLKRPTFMRIPGWAIEMMYGEAASVLMQGQKVVGRRLPEGGFQFLFPDIRSSLNDLLR